ncbi:hypothetical protein, partial [Mesorhizobium sp.]|uniref:hypothetical protein n=1 Tax=Mesorhizobium sp. TaxID=1871066 RepID=UPI0025903ACF
SAPQRFRVAIVAGRLGRKGRQPSASRLKRHEAEEALKQDSHQWRRAAFAPALRQPLRPHFHVIA